MTRIHCRTLSLITAVVLLPLSGCAQPSGFTSAGREEVIAVGTPTNVLTCAQAPASVQAETQTIGPAGGQLRAGNSELNIPTGAVSESRRFMMRELDRGRVGVDIDQKVIFAPNRSAMLTIDMSRCTSEELGSRQWFVWRLSQGAGESQKLATRIAGSRALVQIDSTSLFILAD